MMRYVNLLGYAAIPVAFLIHYWLGKDKSWEPVATFIFAAVGVIPLAHLMGESTEHLSERTGPTWGGLLNATFGNAAELIIAIIALTRGLTDIVKASLTGSILGNLLLVGGLSMVAGGWKRERQIFNRQAAETNSGLLALAVAMLVAPAIFHYTAQNLHDAHIATHEHRISMACSLVLLLVYGLGLLFTLRTHAHIYSPQPARSDEDKPGLSGIHRGWSVRRSVAMLLIAAGGIAIVAELLVKSAEQMAHTLGWNHIFVGVILLAIIGNAAEHSTAMVLAMRNDMDTAMTITYQSSLQIALFVTPLLIFVSAGFVAAGWSPPTHLNLVFSPMEVVSVMLTVLVVVVIGINGESNWFEGVLLLALYLILAICFFYIPGAAPGH